MSRSFIIALFISFGIHISGMSLVGIVLPQENMVGSGYPRVDFLGPILRKTAFDIMLENATPIVKTTYSFTDRESQDKILKVPLIRMKPKIEEFPKELEDNMDDFVRDYLSTSKIVPRFALDLTQPITAERRLIYKPSPPFIIKGQYGDKDSFRIKARIGIDRNGNVKAVELITTTGYASLDIIASKFLKAWIFEPGKGMTESDEWHETEVLLDTVK